MPDQAGRRVRPRRDAYHLPMPGPNPHQRQRRLALGTYLVTVALTSTGYIATFTIAALAAPQLTGSRASSGLPSAVAVAGTAVAAAVLSTLMARRGRRAGIVAGLAVGSAGAVAGLLSMLIGSFALLIGGSLAIGFANAASQLTRYAAADLSPGARASALSLIVWGSTIGAVVGPNLVAPAGSLAPRLGWDPLAGGLAVALLFVLAALAVATFGPRAPQETRPVHVDPGSGVRAISLLRTLLRTIHGRTAVLALGSGQLVMVLIMTMTPLHLHESGHGLEIVGLVIGAHTLGMFGLAPVSGWLVDRIGGPTVAGGGFALLAVAGLLAAMTPPDAGTALAAPLFLLGVGWSLTFVSGSSLLAAAGPLSERARLQGATDALVWTVAALSSLASGVVLDLIGYGLMAMAGAAVAVLLGLLIAIDRRGQPAASPASPSSRSST
jgi:MFS family permease